MKDVQDSTLSLACVRGLVIAVWRDAPTGGQLRELRRAMEEARERFETTALINLVLSGTPSFSAEVRDESARLTRDNDWTLGTAHIVLVDGFTGVAVRSFFSTMLLLGRPKVPTKVFGSLEDGCVWLEAILRSSDMPWTAASLADACHETCHEACHETRGG